MAKKNSSKTATEKAIQSSEPRIATFRGWKGVNYVDSPLTWDPLESGDGKFRQTDLAPTFFMVQNNLETTPTLGVETRHDSMSIGDMPDSDKAAGWKFTGISCMHLHWLFAVARRDEGQSFKERIYYRSLLSDDTSSWSVLKLSDPSSGDDPDNYEIAEIGFYESRMLATTKRGNNGKLFLGLVSVANGDISIKGMDWSNNTESRSGFLVSNPHIDDPTTPVNMTAVGMKSGSGISEDDSHVVRIETTYAYVNRFGSTLACENHNTIYVEFSPTLWSSSSYVKLSYPGTDTRIIPGSGITGIDFYGRDTENTDWVFIGHIDVTPRAGGVAWSYNWLGNMTDISQWATSQLQTPTANDTMGPEVSHFAVHDSRLYYWGVPDKPYRLYIGGNVGAEFSIARGLGGAWVDIEPGSGYDIMGTAKWKTVSGANIVTIMCGNRNTNKVKRFNLVETSISVTNEINYKSYMYEEVSNVVGCNSRYGYGVFSDGLYSLSRYGLLITTMAMEYNAQMKSQSVSEAIKPLFTERLGAYLRDGRMICINDVIYIALSEDSDRSDPVNLDNVILCYDIGLQAWYTFTHDQVYGNGVGNDPDKIHHILAIDSDEFTEGLGAITDTQVRLYPTTGIQEPTVPKFQVILETGELMHKSPMQEFTYIQQLEFRFDYFVGDPNDPAEILVEGTDYYGRQFKIRKLLNIESRGNHGLTGEQRNYIEWIRVDKIVESMRIRVKGRARFRLTHIVSKVYGEANVIGTPYGFDAHDTFKNRSGMEQEIHHYINDYDNLRRAIIV